MPPWGSTPLTQSPFRATGNGLPHAIRTVGPWLSHSRTGKVSSVPGIEGYPFPRGWAPDGSLWLQLAVGQPRAEMVRVDVRDGRVVQREVVRLTDSTGVTNVGGVLPGPDGKGFIFTYSRELGSLLDCEGTRLLPPLSTAPGPARHPTYPSACGFGGGRPDCPDDGLEEGLLRGEESIPVDRHGSAVRTPRFRADGGGRRQSASPRGQARGRNRRHPEEEAARAAVITGERFAQRSPKC